jgi:hypothetical protein
MDMLPRLLMPENRIALEDFVTCLVAECGLVLTDDSLPPFWPQSAPNPHAYLSIIKIFGTKKRY